MLVGTLGVLVGVEVLVGDVDVPVLAPVVAVVLAGWVTLVELLLDVELLLPQPAINTPASARTSNVECCLIMCPLCMFSPSAYPLDMCPP